MFLFISFFFLFVSNFFFLLSFCIQQHLKQLCPYSTLFLSLCDTLLALSFFLSSKNLSLSVVLSLSLSFYLSLSPSFSLSLSFFLHSFSFFVLELQLNKRTGFWAFSRLVGTGKTTKGRGGNCIEGSHGEKWRGQRERRTYGQIDRQS